MRGNKTWSSHYNARSIIRIIAMMFMDYLLISISYILSLWVRFDFSFLAIDPVFLENIFLYSAITAVTAIVVYHIFRLYHSVWTYAGFSEATRVTIAYVILLPIDIIEKFVFRISLPTSVYMMGYVTSYLLCIISRMGFRVLQTVRSNIHQRGEKENVMIIGAGAAGLQLIREYKFSKHLNAKVCCIIDDNPQKWNRELAGVPIVGGRDEIVLAAEKYHIDRIIFAIPTIDYSERKAILNICKEVGCTIQVLPGMYQLINGDVSLKQLRKIELSDLLGREEIHVNNDEIFQAIGNKVVLVTGGGGSIGSELCRQVAAANPKRLIIFDIYENNAFAIQQELRSKYPQLELSVIIGSVRDRERMEDIFRTYHPQVIYHAAAHKHVPLMEDSPNEAIKNNVFGTWNVAVCAAEYKAEKMILISTDKAVNPTNVMGASKRICEMVVQMMSRKNTNTKFVAVRFGNVLGSNGSVVPLFEKQIAAGGPVTVTDKNIIRYFMTIQEAVSLVLQAGFFAKGGEIFVLDMGDPVKIDDMARTLIRLSGHIPDVDIKIEYVGLRPGEKLYEELLMEEEGLEKTAHNRIFKGQPILMDDHLFEEQLQTITEECWTNPEDIRTVIGQIVPTYHPAEICA